MKINKTLLTWASAIALPCSAFAYCQPTNFQCLQQEQQQEAARRAQEQQQQMQRQQEAAERQQQMQRAQAQQSRPSAAGSGPGSAHSNSPTTYEPRAYVPGNHQAAQSQSSESRGTTFTPHSQPQTQPQTQHNGDSAAAPSRRSDEGVTSNGVVTFTPHAIAQTQRGGEEPPRQSDKGVTANGVTTFTPHAVTAGRPVSAESGTASAHSEPFTPSPNISSQRSANASPSNASPPENQTVTSLSRQQINAARSNLSGINSRPIPNGTVTAQANGTLVKTADGRQYGLRENGSLVSYHGHGTDATFATDGRIRSLHSATLDINRSATGARTVVLHRPDHSVVVSTGAHSGYVERTLRWHGQEMVQRTYVSGNHLYTRTYAQYVWHGVPLQHYMPPVLYAPPFYGWAYYPWAAPVAYSWPWMGSPWYVAASGYFVPLPAYRSPALWLTDFLLAGTVAAIYAQQQATEAADQQNTGSYVSSNDSSGNDGAYAQTDTPITPELQQNLSEQVTQQLAAENAAAQKPEDAQALTGLPRALESGHLFVVDHSMNVTNDEGRTCGLAPGDVLKLQAVPADDAITANLIVSASRKDDCPANSQINVAIQDLQDMHNGFRAQLTAGLQALHDQQGTNGLPAAPASAIAPPPRPVEDMPPPGSDAVALVSGAPLQADHAEAQIVQNAFSNK